MAYGTHAAALHDGVPHGWRRWLYSTNHKDIGTMYLCFALWAVCLGVPVDGNPGRADGEASKSSPILRRTM